MFDAFVQQQLSPQALTAQMNAMGNAKAEELAAGRPVKITHQTATSVDYQFGSLADAAQKAMDVLRANAPVKSGAYRDSFFVVVDGQYHPPGAAISDIVGANTKEVIIGNAMPQNRKVDVQVSNGRPLRFSVPAHLFQDAVDAVNHDTSKLAQAERLADYTAFPGRYQPKHGAIQFQTPAIRITLASSSGWGGTLLEVAAVFFLSPLVEEAAVALLL